MKLVGSARPAVAGPRVQWLDCGLRVLNNGKGKQDVF